MKIFLLAQAFSSIQVHFYLKYMSFFSFNLSQTFGRKERRRPHSVDVSYLISGTTDSTLTTATHLWLPKPLSLDPDSKVSVLPNATIPQF